jgi:hypothetical protein
MRPSLRSSPSECDGVKELDYCHIARTLRARMMTNALSHLEGLDVRTGTVLAATGFVQDRDPPTRLTDVELATLSEDECTNRVPSPPGPLIFYWSEKPSERSVNDVRSFVLLPDVRDRAAALDYFVRLAGHTAPSLTPSTRAVLDETAVHVRSIEPDVWRPAAIKLHDALTEDLFLCISGFNQSKVLRFQEGSNQFATVLLRPSLRMVDTIPLRVRDPSLEREKLLQIIAECREQAGSIEEACTAYFGSLGHLPLDHTLGMGRVVERWIGSLPKGEVWSAVWDWADKIGSPLARYHACLLFLETPALVPEERRVMLRDEILDVIRGVHVDGNESGWSQSWRVRCDLARHYAYFFECQIPGLGSERVANLAWWLAERVGSEFGRSHEHLSRVHSDVVQPALDLSSQVWELVRPGLLPSALRLVTLHVSSCWSLSLLCQIGQFPEGIRPAELMGERGPELRKSLIAGTLGSFPAPRDTDEAVTFAFDRTTTRSAEAWIEDVGVDTEDEEHRILKAVLAMSRDNAAPEELRRRLGLLPDVVEGERFLVCQMLRSLAFFSRLPEDLIWEFITRREWFARVLSSLDPLALDLLFDALIEYQLQQGGRWAHTLPRLVASVALDPEVDPERRKLLLAYCVIASLAGGTTDAVAGFLHSDQRTLYERDLAYWRLRCAAVFAVSPAWAQARLRPLLAMLSKMQGNLQVNDADEKPG